MPNDRIAVFYASLNNMKFYNILIILLAFGASVLLSNCSGGYSFTGTSLPRDVQTVYVAYIENTAPLIMPTLSNKLTEQLTDKFTRQTKLTFTEIDADLQFEGEITNYDVTSMAVQAGEYAAQNRLTVAVRIRFTNAKEEKQNFNKSFSAYADFPSEQSLDVVQNDLVEEIIRQLVENIFNDSVANW